MASGEHGSHQPVRSTDAEPDGTLAKGLASEDILEILRIILASASLKEVLTSVARVVESHREGMLCSVWLLDQDHVHMRAIAAPTLPESYVAALDGFVVGPQGGSCGAAVNQRKPVFVSDVLTDPILEQVRDIIAAHGIRACWSAPIISHQGEILGTFAFYFRSVRSPSPRDIHLIENATSIAGIAIERKKAEENLRRSEWSLLEAQRLGHSGSWSLDVSSGMVTTSPEMLRSFDVKPGDDCSSPDFWFNRIHPDDRKRVRDLFERCVMEKTDYEAHYRLLLPDGTIKYQHSIGRPIVNEKGDLVEFVGTAIDVTEQAQARIELEKPFEEIKQRTEAARRSERELRDVVNTVPANIWSTSPEGAVDFVNDRCLQFTGLALDEIFGWKWEPVLHPDDRTRVVADWHTAVKNERAMESEARVRRADGEYCWWFIRNVPLRDETGKLVRWYGTGIDIHDRKQAEEALQRSEGYLAEAQKLTRTGSWAAHVHQMENLSWSNFYWSEELYRIFGFDPGPTPPSEVEIGGRLHPEDVLCNRPVVEQAIRDRSDFEVDYRLVLPNGAAKYIHVVGHPIVNASGDVIEIVGTAMDVTEQHEARAALQAAFEQIKAERTELRRMTDAVAAFIYVLRPDGTALCANQTVLDYTGLTLEDLQREDQRARVFHPEDLERLREERQVAFARGKPFELEQRALGKDGNYRWFLARYNPLRDDQGNIIRWYATGTDIDDRKRT